MDPCSRLQTEIASLKMFSTNAADKWAVILQNTDAESNTNAGKPNLIKSNWTATEWMLVLE